MVHLPTFNKIILFFVKKVKPTSFLKPFKFLLNVIKQKFLYKKKLQNAFSLEKNEKILPIVVYYYGTVNFQYYLVG